jgi:hypothetical protein
MIYGSLLLMVKLTPVNPVGMDTDLPMETLIARPGSGV